MISALFILAITSVAIAIPWRFFHLEKRKCQKYAFYRLRDQVILRIVDAEDPEPYLKTYRYVNGAISLLHHFNFRSFLSFRSEALADALEKEYMLERGEPVAEKERPQINDLDVEFYTLLGTTAEKNSLLLRLAMTPIGYKVVSAPVVVRAVIKFLNRHPELSKKAWPKLQALRFYSNLGASLREKDEDKGLLAHC